MNMRVTAAAMAAAAWIAAGWIALTATPAQPPAAAGPAGHPDGAKIFAENCAACHQAHGEGVEGAFPKLDGDAFVQGPQEQVAKLLLNGRGGMPSFSSDLSDEQIAAVTSYVRGAWSNHAAPIPAAIVTAARKGAAVEEKSSLPYH